MTILPKIMFSKTQHVTYLDAFIDAVYQPTEQSAVEVFGKCITGIIGLKLGKHYLFIYFSQLLQYRFTEKITLH